MSLLDTIDGVFMNFAYGWAFAKPVRKVYYNLTVTVAVGGRRPRHRHHRADRRSWPTRPTSSPARWPRSPPRPDLRRLRIVAFFVLAWLVSLAVWKFGRVEEKWSAKLQPGG